MLTATDKKLDTRVTACIRIEKAALDESAVSPAGAVMRGRIAASTLRFLRVDREYQRNLENRPDIFEAFKNGKVLPDIDIGVRGQDFHFEGDDCIIDSPAYIVDGAQRVGTALTLIDLIPDLEIRIGALIHFDTTQAWEAERFTALNSNAKKVSPSLHLRNMRAANVAVLTLFGLSNNSPGGVLQDRICWEQSTQKGHIMTALTLAKVCRDLHSQHMSMSGDRLAQIAGDLNGAVRKISLASFRSNCLTFFEVIDECYGLRTISARKPAPQIKSTFMRVLARLFCRHENFWSDSGKILTVDSAWRHCLEKFPLQDPTIAHLASSGGPAHRVLYGLLRDHANSGKRTNMLVERPPRRPA